MASDSNEEPARREVYFSGRVQGVGFRYTTRQIAGRFDVVGYVQNLPDGRVLLVAEGPSEALDGFVAAVTDEMERYIQGVQQTESAAGGEFTRFDVRY